MSNRNVVKIQMTLPIWWVYAVVVAIAAVMLKDIFDDRVSLSTVCLGILTFMIFVRLLWAYFTSEKIEGSIRDFILNWTDLFDSEFEYKFCMDKCRELFSQGKPERAVKAWLTSHVGKGKDVVLIDSAVLYAKWHFDLSRDIEKYKDE